MIDIELRKKLSERTRQDQTQKNIFGGMFNAMEEGLELKKENKEIMGKMEARDRTLLEMFEKVGRAIVMIFKRIPNQVKLPDIFKIKGEVEVIKTPDIKITNFQDLKLYFESLEITLENAIQQLKVKKTEPTKPIELEVKNLRQYFQSLEGKLLAFAQAASTAPAPQITIPEFPKMPKIDNKEIIRAIEELKDVLDKPTKDNSSQIITVLNRVKDSIDELVSKPVYIPQPATNVQINALQGVAKTTAVTVGTGLTQLPDYGQLNNRRSLIIFNNSSSVTIYVGGSDLTSSNGLPVPAQTYSPPIDAGYNMVIYGRTASSTADVRVMEVSKDLTNNIQG